MLNMRDDDFLTYFIYFYSLYSSCTKLFSAERRLELSVAIPAPALDKKSHVGFLTSRFWMVRLMTKR